MNVITIMSDEHSGSAMGCAGDPLSLTPNLDGLARRGTRFTNAYTPCPLCVPARAAWFTGRYVNRLGTWDNSTPYDGAVTGISHYLKKFGILTYQIGKTHFHPQGNYDFEEEMMPGYLKKPDLGCYYRDKKLSRPHAQARFKKIGIREEESHDDQVTRLAVQWLKERKAGSGIPWALNIGYLDPHFPFCVKKENWDYFDQRIRQIPEGTKPPFTSLNEPLSYLQTYFEGEVADEETVRRRCEG